MTLDRQPFLRTVEQGAAAEVLAGCVSVGVDKRAPGGQLTSIGGGDPANPFGLANSGALEFAIPDPGYGTVWAEEMVSAFNQVHPDQDHDKRAPVKLTLLTGGILNAAMRSRAAGAAHPTAELAISYHGATAVPDADCDVPVPNLAATG